MSIAKGWKSGNHLEISNINFIIFIYVCFALKNGRSVSIFAYNPEIPYIFITNCYVFALITN